MVMADVTNVKDGGWGWVVVCASFVINFIMDGVRYSFGLLYIEFLSHFDASKAASGLVGGIMFGLLLIFAPISAFLVNKFGCRLVTMAGSCLVFLGFFCSVFATGIGYLYITLGLLGGVGFSMLFMTMYIVVIERFERYRSLAIGLAVSGSGLGGFAFSPLTNFMIETYTWRGTLLILSAILLNGCVCGTVMRPVKVKGGNSVNTDRVVTDGQTEQSVLITQSSNTVSDTVEQNSDEHNEDSVTSPITNSNVGAVEKGDGKIKDRVKQIDEDVTVPLPLGQTDYKSVLQTEGTTTDETTYDCDVYCSSVNTTHSTTHNTTHTVVTDTAETAYRSRCYRFLTFLSKTFRFSLLSNKLFVLFAIFLVCINISFMVPFIYVPDMARVRFEHVTRTELVWLPNAMSIANVVSRVPIGLLADTRIISNVSLMGILCFVTGISCLLMPFCGSYPLLLTACVCYSACIVSAMVLVPTALSELFGDDVIADSFGLSLFFGGVSGLIGTPLAGWLFDLTDTYELTFIIAGTEFALGGCVLFLITGLRSKIRKH